MTLSKLFTVFSGLTAFSRKKGRVSPDIPSGHVKAQTPSQQIPSQQTPSKRFLKSLSAEAEKLQNTKNVNVRIKSLNERLDALNNPSGLSSKQKEQNFNQRFKDLNLSWLLLKNKPKPLSKNPQDTAPLLEKLYQSQIKANKIDTDLIDAFDT